MRPDQFQGCEQQVDQGGLASDDGCHQRPGAGKSGEPTFHLGGIDLELAHPIVDATKQDFDASELVLKTGDTRFHAWIMGRATTGHNSVV